MKITECPADYVFTRIGAGYTVHAVDFEKMTYSDPMKMTVQAVAALVNKAKEKGTVKFFQLEEKE
ncbi:MAG: hypothetical protein K6E41_04480 [Solobacterium sp.]|nr:hypothetical protein [Solobacterium sp.]